MTRIVFWWFSRLVFRFVKWTSGLEHAHYFLESEVRNIKIDPRCVHCGMPLSEATKELQDKKNMNFKA